MKRIFTTAAVAAALTISSCSRLSTESMPAGEGSISLGVNIDTKAAMSGEELLMNASVDIYMADYSGLVRHYIYEDAPECIYLPAEEYRIDVLAGEAAKEKPAEASWEQRSYKGSSVFTVTTGANTGVTVDAVVDNVITKVSFDSSITDYFAAGYTFTIGTSNTDTGKQLIYDSRNSGNEGYFLVSGFEPSLYWTFTGTEAASGASFSKSGEISAVEKGKLYTLTPKYTVHDGELNFDLKVDYDVEIISDIIIFEPVSTGLASTPATEIWAGHTTLYADVDESEYSNPDAIKFAYSADGKEWTTVDARKKTDGFYCADIKGLSGSTTYTYKLVIEGEEIGESRTFTTESAPQLPNYDFETVSNDESSKYCSFYDPGSSNPELKSKFWDSGNSASASYGFVICNSSTDVPKGTGSTRSAILESANAVVKFAAGNLFTGSFAGLDGLNGKVNFGRKWTSRPTAVRLWYSYSAGKVTHTATGCPLTKDDYDSFSIQVALGTWSNRSYGGSLESPVQVNTGDKKTLYNYEVLPETIAYGKLEGTGTGSRSEWEQVTIELDYHSTDEYPTHIIVSCAASKYGDYFAGCQNAKLWVDNIELVYD